MKTKRPNKINDVEDALQEIFSRLEALERPQKIFNASTENKFTKKSRDFLKKKGKKL